MIQNDGIQSLHNSAECMQVEAGKRLTQIENRRSGYDGMYTSEVKHTAATYDRQGSGSLMLSVKKHL